MLQRADQRQVERDVGGDRHHDDVERRARVAARRKARDQHLDQHEGRQADGEGGQRIGRGDGGRGVEGAALEQHADDRLVQRHQPGRGGQGQQQGELDGAILVGQCRVVAAGPDLARQQRQQGGADGDADHAQRQLVDAVGVVEIGDCAGRQERGPDDVQHGVDLLQAAADGGRRGQQQQVAHARTEARPYRPQHHAGPGASRRQPQILHDAGGEDAPGQGMAGGRQQRRQAQR